MKRTKLFFYPFWYVFFCYLRHPMRRRLQKEKEPARFGIGIAYGFKDRVKELIRQR